MFCLELNLLFYKQNEINLDSYSILASASCSKGAILEAVGLLDSSKYCIFTGEYTADPNDTTSVYLDWDHPALEEMRRRAEIIGNFKWTPKGDVPKRNGFFPQGKEVSGIPYSSVKELDKFVGQEVSFYTFLSAVNNPRSVLYTENVSNPPYQGKNCAAYYGSVCSMTVNYALGLERPYETLLFPTLPFIKRVANQDIEHAAPGDIVFDNSGHVFLITNITKFDDGIVEYIDILECSGNGAHNRRYTKERFQERLNNCTQYVFYRYMDLQKLASEQCYFPFIEANLNANMSNNALSLNRGDKVTYCHEEGDVVVYVLEAGYDLLKIYRIDGDEDLIVEERTVEGTPDIVLKGLAEGCYKALLVKNDGSVSEAVNFEIIQTKVSFTKHGRYVNVSFSSTNAIPEYIVFCERRGSRYFITDITESDRQSGNKTIRCSASLESLYLKVFFKGEYGRVSNTMIPLL